ncbi:hypothetical protein [Polaromonas sp.]
MEFKTARLALLIDPNKKAALERLCAQRSDKPPPEKRRVARRPGA